MISAAIGAAVTDDPGADPSSLINAADESMLRRKGINARTRVDQEPRRNPTPRTT